MADDVIGTAGEEPGADPVIPESPPSTPGTTEPESFINPADLPPELKPHWSRMHSAYTKALQKTKGRQPDLELVDRYRNDPAFARDFLTQEAQRLGLSIASPTQAQTATPSDIPQALIAEIEANLPQELKWLARPLAASTWKAQGHLIAPLLRDTRQKEVSTKTAEYDDLAADLSEKAPGWEAHEDDMNELFDFLTGPAMRDRRWGSKIEFLYNAVTGNARATSDAVRRIGLAARSASTTGMPSRSTATNIDDRVRAAPTSHDAFKIAAEHAVEELRRAGVDV